MFLSSVVYYIGDLLKSANRAFYGTKNSLVYNMIVYRHYCSFKGILKSHVACWLTILYTVAIWLVTGQGVENTKWPAVLYSQ